MANLGEDLSDEIVEEMINKVDTDGDGRIGFEGTPVNLTFILKRVKLDTFCTCSYLVNAWFRLFCLINNKKRK